MSDNQRFTHTDLDGDMLNVRAGMLGAILEVGASEDGGFEGAVAVRYNHLPALIAALQGILDESDHEPQP